MSIFRVLSGSALAVPRRYENATVGAPSRAQGAWEGSRGDSFLQTETVPLSEGEPQFIHASASTLALYTGATSRASRTGEASPREGSPRSDGDPHEGTLS